MGNSSEEKHNRREFLKKLGLGIGGVSLFGLVSSPFLLRPGFTSGKIVKRRTIHLDGVIGLMSYNIAVGSGEEGIAWSCASFKEKKNNLDKIVEIILDKKVSIVGLNEVDFGYSVEGKTQEKYIADKLADEWGVSYFVGGKHADFPLFRFGNAIISKYPITSYLPETFGNYFGRLGHQCKGFVDANIHTPYDLLDVMVTHFHDSNEENRIEEADFIIECLKRKEHSFVLMGDFNDVPESKIIKQISDIVNPVELDLLTQHSKNTTKKFDYIFTSNNLDSFGQYVVCSDASDHCAIGCYLDLVSRERRRPPIIEI